MILKCKIYFFILPFIFYKIGTNALINDYIFKISGYLGYNSAGKNEIDSKSNEFDQNVPYEVSIIDQKFISEAAKLTGVSLSELDSCQQRVVLKLKNDCHKINDEQLAKMGVHLLNCQSYVEGRKIFPCSDEMTIKDCTIEMDSDTWTSYHIMSNRAKAVCYMIRQTQFRGLAEHTVNRLMDATKDQLKNLEKITTRQENINDLVQNTFESLNQAQTELLTQQQDIQRAQFHGQLVLENNIVRLIDEKRLINHSHNKVVNILQEVFAKLNCSAQVIENQNIGMQDKHKELLESVILIQSKIEDLFNKIDTYLKHVLKQNKAFEKQYESTFNDLKEINRTINIMMHFVKYTGNVVETKFAWIVKVLGANDDALHKLNLILEHVGFILITMLICAFLSASLSSRIIVISMPLLNLLLAWHGEKHMTILLLTGVIAALKTGYILYISLIKLRSNFFQKTESKRTPWVTSEESTSKLKYRRHSESDEEVDGDETSPLKINSSSVLRSRARSNTPLLLNDYHKELCHARTRAGTPCKLFSIHGREYCRRHQNEHSIMG